MRKFAAAAFLSILTVLACARPLRFQTEDRSRDRAASSSRVVVGYYSTWNRSVFDHTMISYRDVTHIALAFAWPDDEGNLVFPEGYLYPELIQSAHLNGTKVLMSLGGWGNDGGFAPTALDPAKRAKFILQITAACRDHGFDGADIDWEFVDTPEEKEGFSSLIRELSAALRAMDPPRRLSMAAPAGEYYGRWIDFEGLHPFFDFIGFMTYDFHGPWSEHAGHNAPLFSCGDPCGSMDDTFRYARSRGIPLSKILLGIPFYGRSFDSPRLYGAFQDSGEFSYAEIMDFRTEGWAYSWDAYAAVPFLTRRDGGAILSFDDEASVRNKCRYILDNDIAGILIWEISQDRFRGKSVLLEIIGDELVKENPHDPYR